MNKQMTRQEIFLFQVERNIKTLYKAFLASVEELQQRHDESLDKLESMIPEQAELISAINTFDEEEVRRVRKKVLDGGNDCLRNIEEAAKNCGIIN
jgi:hypothetical protein